MVIQSDGICVSKQVAHLKFCKLGWTDCPILNRYEIPCAALRADWKVCCSIDLRANHDDVETFVIQSQNDLFTRTTRITQMIAVLHAF